MTITSVPAGSITTADTSLTISGTAVTNNNQTYPARPVTLQASADGGTTWTNVGILQLAACDAPQGWRFRLDDVSRGVRVVASAAGGEPK